MRRFKLKELSLKYFYDVILFLLFRNGILEHFSYE